MRSVPEIVLPANGWRPRHYQRKLWDYFKRGGKRAIEIAHRRWGKDDLALHLACRMAHVNVATYWHMLPEYEQARKAIWNAVNPHTGLRRIDEAFPLELRSSTDEQSMFIRFKIGSTWQVIGSDNYKSLVGTPPAGIVFSEWAKAHPGAWAYLAPILVENGGWALFITTPEGRNHAYSMFEMARTDAAWLAELQTVEDSGAMSTEQVEQQRKEYHSIYGDSIGDALIEQEYFCSFSAAILGAYWGLEMSKVERDGRITKVDVTPDLPIYTAWDIGVDDPMAIWVYQVMPGRINVIDYYENAGYGFDHYCDWLDARGYRGTDWVPHDAKVRDPSAPGARSRIETLFALKRNPKLVPNQDLMDGINAGRKTLPLTWFDGERCKQGIEALRSYRADWDDKARVFRRTPKHDWASHAADAWRYLSVAWQTPHVKPPEPPRRSGWANDGGLTVDDLLRLSTPARMRV
jgi:hypothetical protein